MFAFESLSNVFRSFELYSVLHNSFAIIFEMFVQFVELHWIPYSFYMASDADGQLKYFVFLFLGNVSQFLTGLEIVDLLIVFQIYFTLFSNSFSFSNHNIIIIFVFLLEIEINPANYLLLTIMLPPNTKPFCMLLILDDFTQFPSELALVIIPFAISHNPTLLILHSLPLDIILHQIIFKRQKSIMFFIRKYIVVGLCYVQLLLYKLFSIRLGKQERGGGLMEIKNRTGQLCLSCLFQLDCIISQNMLRLRFATGSYMVACFLFLFFSLII